MNNIELITGIDATTREAIHQTDVNYRRFLKICTDILAVDGNTLTVRVEQFEAPTDKRFSQKELIEKGQEVLSHLPEGLYKIRWRPLEFKGAGIEAVGPQWVRSMAQKHKVSQADMSKALGVDRHVMSRLFSGQFEFTKWHKAAFWYYFKTLQAD